MLQSTTTLKLWFVYLVGDQFEVIVCCTRHRSDQQQRRLSAGVIVVCTMHVDVHHLLGLDAARHEVLHHVREELRDVFALDLVNEVRTNSLTVSDLHNILCCGSNADLRRVFGGSCPILKVEGVTVDNFGIVAHAFRVDSVAKPVKHKINLTNCCKCDGKKSLNQRPQHKLSLTLPIKQAVFPQ